MSPTTAAAPSRARGRRKTKIGIVVSNRMSKTIVVRVSRLVRHPKYTRVIKQTSSFKAHDETNSASIGDWVKIVETRPLSKEKRWRLVEIVRRASTAPPVPGTESEERLEPPSSQSAAAQTASGGLSEAGE